MEGTNLAPPRHRFPPKQSISNPSPESAQPWTATRCHRLLRPLLAHISALRKDKERRALTSSQGSAATGQTTKARRTVLGKRSYPGSDSDYDDKRPCRKYSRKASRKRSPCDQSCTPQRNAQTQRRQPSNKASQDVVLPTPFLRRVRNHQPSSPHRAPDEPSREEPAPANGRCNHRGSGCKTKCAFEVELASLRSTTDAERHGLWESVFKAFDAILRVTSPRKNQSAGPKSLMAMCLRKVPAYIAVLEDWERMEAEEKGTKSAVQGAGVSFETYSELESLGAVDGWRHLCLLVRAHAVLIIQDAAAEGLLEDSVTDILIRVCLEYMPPTEFMSFIDTFVFRQYPKPHSPADDLFNSLALQPLRILRNCDPSGTSLMPGTLANLLAEELLPAEWILTETFVSLWPCMIRHITEMKPCQDTVDFVVTTLDLLCSLASPKKPRGVPQTKLRGKPQTTLVSAVAALGSVVLLSEEGSSETTTSLPSLPNRAVALRRRIDYIVTTCTGNLTRRKAAGRKLGTYLLALCSFLSLHTPSLSSPTTPSPSGSTISTAWKNVTTCHNNPVLLLQYDATTALMSAMAHHLSRGTGLPPQPYLSGFCDKLEALDLPRTALSNMRVDGAFRLAECTGDLRDLEWAEGLRAQQAAAAAMLATPVKGIMSTRSGKGKGKRKVKSFSGFKWDDGISEWVAATPGTEVRPAGGSRRRLSGRVMGRVQSDAEEENVGEDETSEEVDHCMDETASETEMDELNAGCFHADDGDHGDDDSETGFETDKDEDMETEPILSPNTEPSPASVSQRVSEPERHKDQRPHSEAKPPGEAAVDKSSPPPPPGGYLAVRPRRLSRPAPRATDDELTSDRNNDDDNSDHNRTIPTEKESWLRRKKPVRFQSRIPVPMPASKKPTVSNNNNNHPAAAAQRDPVTSKNNNHASKNPTTTTSNGKAMPAARGNPAMSGKHTPATDRNRLVSNVRRVAQDRGKENLDPTVPRKVATARVKERMTRASLVYLQPRSGGVQRRKVAGSVGRGGFAGDGEGESEDELSIL
ncbi:hypothetical protein VTI74DRAFT_8525 [Chaetomium olivicolor]